MKKRVRIYKPTNKFQQGGVQQQYSPDQLITVYMSALSQPGSSVDTAENTLRQLQIDENTIAQVSEAAQAYITEQQDAHNAQAAGDESAMADLQAQSDSDEAAALAEAEAQARSQRMQEMYADYGNQDYGDDTQVASDIIARRGGNMPSKRKFVQTALKLAKKQEGGTDQNFNSPSDSTDTGERKEGLQKFVSALQKTADESLIKKDAEAMYDQFTMMSDEPNPMDYESMDYAQFGGMRPGKQRRMMRRMNRFVGNMPVQMNNSVGDLNLPGVVTFPGMMGMMQQQMPAEGSTYGGPQLANIDVRRTGLFGRPKEYTITFAQQALTDPKLKEDVVKLEEKNQEQAAKDEAKAAEEGTVDQGVEEKKQAEAEEAAVDINDIQVVSGNPAANTVRNNGTPSVPNAEEIEVPEASESGPAFKGFWSGYDPSSVRFAGMDKSRGYVKRGSKWYVSPNFQAKDKKNVQWYEVSDPNRIKNIEANTRKGISQEQLQKMRAKQNQLRQAMNWDKVEEYLPDMPMNKEQLIKTYHSLPDAPSKKQLSNWYESLPDIPGLQTGGFTGQDLFKFIYGGDDGKLTSSPYFAEGGLYRFQGEEDSEVDTETNAKTDTEEEKKTEPTYVQTRVKQKGLPTDVATGERYTGDMMNPELAAINVYKTRALGPYAGMPKKYSVDYMVDDWDPNGTAAASTKQGIFNRNKPSTMNQSRLDTFLDKDFSKQGRRQGFQNAIDRVAPRLGSRLFNNDGYQYYDGESEKMLQGPGQLSNREVRKLQRKDLYDDYMSRFSTQNKEMQQRKQEIVKLPTKPIQNVSSAEAIKAQAEQDILSKQRSSARNPNAIGTLPTRPASPFEQTVSTPAEIIPSIPRASNTNWGVEVPELEPGISGPMGENQARDIAFEQQQQEIARQAAIQDAVGQDMNGILSVPDAQEQYAMDLADQNAIAAQKEDIQRMIEQNPDFFTQGIYNNPVFNPEDMITANTMNLTPEEQQQIAATPVQQKVPVRTRNRNRNQVPVTQTETPKSSNNKKQQNIPVVKSDTTKSTQPVVAKEPEKVVSKKETKVTKKEETPRVYVEPSGSKVYVNPENAQIANSEAKEKATESKQSMLQKSRDFKRKYGVDKTIADQYMDYVEAGDEGMVKFYRSRYPALLYLEPVLRTAKYAYGGTPMAANGFETPIDLDPRFNPDLSFKYENYPIDNYIDIPFDPIPEDIKTEPVDNRAEWDPSRIMTKEEADKIGIEYREPEPKIEYGRKRVRANYVDKGPQKSNAEIQRELMAFNYLGNQALNLFGERGDAERRRQEAEMTGSERNYGSTGIQDRGTYGINSGLIPDMGFTGVAKFGGYFEDGGSYEEGGETYMSEEQIRKFLEEGGELEFV